MATNTHGNLSGDEVHSPYIQIFADETARLDDAATTVYDSNDLYKKALQLDTVSEYVLTSISPTTWSELSAGVITVAEEDTKFLGMTNTYPFLVATPGIPVVVTFPAAPVDLLIKRLAGNQSREIVFGATELDGQRSELGTTFTAITAIRINGTPIDSDGFGTYSLFTDETDNPIELNIPMLAGDLLEIDVLPFVSGSFGSINIEYIDLPASLPVQRNYVGVVAPGIIPVPASSSSATAVITVSLPTPVSTGTLSFDEGFDGDNTSDLIGANTPRTPGSGDNAFDTSGIAFGGGVAGVALEIEDAINDPSNSFRFTALAAGSTVTLTYDDSGPTGDTVSVSSSIPEITVPAKFTGGVMDPPTAVTLVPVPADGTLKSVYYFAIAGEGLLFNDYTALVTLKVNAGPNLLDSQYHGSLLHPNYNSKSPGLDIPVLAGDVIELGITNSHHEDTFVLATAIIE
jgi:hypothetical protein